MNAFDLPPLWAVHISDGVLALPWAAGGFLFAGLLVAGACWRVRDDEIPRVALLAAAFFVATLIHVKLGPTSVHLLLNGLVGVVLGRRAPLALAVGLFLQAALLGHGGFLAMGVNTCVLSLPALAAAGTFALACDAVKRWGRPSPVALFAAGALLGGLTTLATLLLDALVLTLGGAEDWTALVGLLVVAHLPVVGIEAVVCGFAVPFLARVKPEILPGYAERFHPPVDESIRRPETTSVAPLVAALAGLCLVGAAAAHSLKGSYKALPEGRVQVEAWYDITAEPPRPGSKVTVYGDGGRVVTEGQTDEKGFCEFTVEKPEALRVVVYAGEGHRVELNIPASAIQIGDRPLTPIPKPFTGAVSPVVTADRKSDWGLKEVLAGVGFVLALGAFALSWRNAVVLGRLAKALDAGGVSAAAGTRPPAAPPTDPGLR